MRDLRVESRFKNAVLYRALTSEFPERNFMQQASVAIGVNKMSLYGLLALKVSPYLVMIPRGTGRRKRGTRYPVDTSQPTGPAKKIASYFGLSHEELFPASLYALRLPSVIVREFDSPEILSLQEAERLGLLMIAPPQAEQTDMRERDNAIADVLRTLSPREEKIIKMRFGLEDGSEHTFGEIAQHFAVTSGRIMQIEAKAMRKLRHPSRSHRVNAFWVEGSHGTRSEVTQ